MSLLQICQDVAGDVPLAVPSAVVGNGDTNAKLLLAQAQRAADSLASYKDGDWLAMVREFTFPTVAITTTGTATPGSAVVTGIPNTSALTAQIFGVSGAGIPPNTYIKSVDSSSQVTLTQAATTGAGAGETLTFGQWAYALPSDFKRLVDQTMWDRSRRWPLVGPRSAAQWQLYKSGLIGSATFQRRWRVKALTVAGTLADYFCLDPIPTDNGSTLVFEYVSSAWGVTTGGTAISRWQADTDTAYLDERLIMLGTRWRVLNRLGLPYAEELSEYEREAGKAWAHDGGQPVLDLAPQYSTTLIGPWNIPTTGFGGVSG